MEEKREGSRSLSQQEEDALQSIARSDLGGLFKARMDEGFTLLYANDSYYAIHGYTRGQLEQEMHGQAVGLVHPEDVAWVSEHLRRALAENQGTVSFEYRIVRRDGAVVWLLISAGLSQEDGGMVLSGMILDITARKAMEDRLRRSEERFQIAVRQAGISVWEYDIPARRLYSSVSTQGHGEACPVVEQVPQSLIDSGYVHPSGVKEFQGMHEALHRGEPTASCVVQVRSPQGGYRWERIHYTTLFDDRRRPVWAVAIVEDVSDQKYAERRCMQEEQLREMLSVDVLISGKVNLTKNQVEELWGHRSFPAAFQKVQDCDGLFQLMGEYLANAEERKRYRALFRRQALLAKYRAGDRGIWGEYRCVNFDGEILWAALRATIHEDPETGDILLFGYVRDIDSRKKTELALLERAEKDGVTGLYNKATIQTMIQRILQERRGSGGQCALLVIDLDNFKQVNDRYGHLQGDKLLQEIGHILHASFQQKGLVGRIGGDEFVLFLGEIPSEQWVLEQTDALCRMLNIAYEAAEDHVPVSASIGVGLAPHSQAQYEELFRQADAGLYHAKQQGKARYSCCRDEGFLEGEGTVTSLQCAAKEHLGTHCMLDALEDMLFVIDLETYEMRYMNAPARAAFGYEEGAYAGRKCYQVLQGFSQPCVFCQNHLPSEQGFKTWENQNVRLHRRFLIRDKIIQWDGRPARLEIYQAPAAQVLRRRFGPGNVYRINGDEFVVFRTDVTYRKFAGDVEACQQLLEEQAPGAVAFGWTWADQDIQIQGMVHHAGEALQLEKQRHGKGKGAWGQQAFWGLEEAFAKGHFHIYLQPKAEIASGRIRGAEALIRYRDDQHGVVGPDKFIPQLERSGLIRHIDLFVLEEVCRTLRRWREQGVEPIPISLNLSRYTLMEKGILARINGITSRYQVDRRLLKLEITESIGDVERRILEEISREIVGDGYCLSLDDFGAQYSNLSILSSLQLSELKIDKSIINDLYSNQNTRILVEHLIHICRQLGIDSVAEGVEEREQLQILEDIGCTYAQGYLYNKPIPVPDFERKYLAGPGNDP